MTSKQWSLEPITKVQYIHKFNQLSDEWDKPSISIIIWQQPNLYKIDQEIDKP